MQIIRILLACFIAAATSLQAVQLKFVPGSEATYKIVDNNTIDAGQDGSGIFNREKEIAIKLLSANEGNFPFVVQCQLNKIKINQQHQEKNLNISLTYDSAAPEATPRNIIVEKCLTTLIGSPLVFTVDKNEKGKLTVVETSGRLEEFENNWQREKYLWEDISDEPFYLPILDFKGFLHQLFHLAGEELEKGSKHDVEILSIVVEDHDEDIKIEVEDVEAGRYTIDQISPPLIKGSLKGKATIIERDDSLKKEQKIKFDGDVKWNTKNALIQYRTIKIDIKLKDEDGDRIKASGEIKWKPITTQ